MERIAIRQAGARDAEALNAALAQLSAALGDPHLANAAALARACFGPEPAAHALLAEAGAEVMGVALYSPLMSTARGRAGVFVSDLWVADAARGRGLGPRLLAAVAADAGARWDAGFLKLAVYHSTPRARAFYDRLGFLPATGETVMTLAGAPFDALKGEA
ncbi:GNAT family N-acetyltransferase [Maritimibacter sp. 55A14]|uniref:GNAT family N-acetyltransferase n=1 Tax=Maritimibacter sp. 55A14 TaxID=2174844 RepID=UPI000D60B792|nr:GNAT family N-acetyltransferase [Maritimibacter sp. 55A14]PWE33238.1 GNAT family N-acetyltransferase [Maritimibacter sp. 55A14]